MGHFCENGTTHAYEFPCPQGYYRNETMGQSLDDCFPCPGGQYCSGEGNAQPDGLCDEGTLCSPMLSSQTLLLIQNDLQSYVTCQMFR